MRLPAGVRENKEGIKWVATEELKTVVKKLSTKAGAMFPRWMTITRFIKRNVIEETIRWMMIISERDLSKEDNMNQQRRKRLEEASDLMNRARDILEEVKDEEQEAYDNLPENFQNGERGEEMQGYIDAIEEAYDGLDTACSAIEQI